jgi:ferredoxin--NADP+ reductase
MHPWTAEPAGERPRHIDLRFWLAPAEIIGSGRVEGLRLERTTLSEAGRVLGTGEYETLPVGMVLRSVGYQSVPLAGVPFDARSSTIPHEHGRVTGGTREYVAGWIKRGPSGVVGTNKSDAAETVTTLLADLSGRTTEAGQGIETLLEARGLQVVTYADWLKLDATEIALAAELDRGERVKLGRWTDMLDATRA